MNKKIKITETEILDIVNFIKESFNINDYDDTDFIEVFIKFFRPWIKKTHGDEVGEYPMSFLVKKYYEDFAKDMGIDSNRHWGSGTAKFSKIGREIVLKGLHKLPSLGKEDKFTEKYKKGIELLVKNLELPDFVTVKFEEERPYFVRGSINFDFESLLKSNLDNVESRNLRNVQSEVRKSFENFLGVTYGNPSHGELSLQFGSDNMVGEDEWIKKELNKKIKAEIKQLPGSSSIHRIKYERNGLNSSIKLIFKSDSRWSTHREIKDNVKTLLRNMGYNTNMLEVDS